MNKFLKKLEFDVIIDKLVNKCISHKAQELASHLELKKDIEELNAILDNTYEALRITSSYQRAPIYFSKDITPLIAFIKKGGILEGLEIYEINKIYKTIKANITFLNNLKKENIESFYYSELVEKLIFPSVLYEYIEKSIDEDGYVLDEASFELKNIRRKLALIDTRIKNKLQEILSKDANKLSFGNVTLRDGHYCLPYKAEYKNSIKGNILDISMTQQTVFIEPMVIIELQGAKAELINEEKKEIQKILSNITNDLYLNIDDLLEDYQRLIQLDLVFAKAALALDMKANRVHINNQNILILNEARHPLLNVEEVIPNDIDLQNNLGIIVTGPNTGGKTVLLKTVGLLSVMLSAGLLIPASETSNVMIFDMVCCDIGDDQSIKDNLSTFSAHMKNIINILDIVTDHSLVIIDEIGSGTDPKEGCNLAIAIIDYLIKHQINFIVTTHYSELISYAFNQEKVINASMEFDVKTLAATYKLRMGIPGTSNALQICKNLGLKEEILNNAVKRTSLNKDEVKNIINKLDAELIYYKKQTNLLNEKIAEYHSLIDKYHKLEANFEKEKEKRLQEALKKANSEILKKKEEATNLLNTLKDKKNQAIKLHEAINLQKAIENLDSDEEETISLNDENETYQVGDDVYVRKFDQYGFIVKVEKNHKYQVSMGNVVMTLNNHDLTKSTPKKENIKQSDNVTIFKPSNVSYKLRLDLRGMRFEEAKDALEKYFDDVVLNNIKQFSIIHGYGTGTIRKVVHEFLSKQNNVASYRYGEAGEGGYGVTVVELK